MVWNSDHRNGRSASGRPHHLKETQRDRGGASDDGMAQSEAALIRSVWIRLRRTIIWRGRWRPSRPFWVHGELTLHFRRSASVDRSSAHDPDAHHRLTAPNQPRRSLSSLKMPDQSHAAVALAASLGYRSFDELPLPVSRSYSD